MLLTEYLQNFTDAINEYSKTGYIITSEVKIDARTEKIGIIKASLVFLDDSKLLVTEYIDLRYRLEKLTYSFHYQDKDGRLVFRYDNAVHKPVLGFKNHKHCKGGVIIQSDAPELRDILEEIMSRFIEPTE
jgi:hypothetical protein